MYPELFLKGYVCEIRLVCESMLGISVPSVSALSSWSSNPSAYKALIYSLRSLVLVSLWPALTLQFVFVASLCNGLLICVFLCFQVLPVFLLFIYKNPSLPYP